MENLFVWQQTHNATTTVPVKKLTGITTQKKLLHRPK